MVFREKEMDLKGVGDRNRQLQWNLDAFYKPTKTPGDQIILYSLHDNHSVASITHYSSFIKDNHAFIKTLNVLMNLLHLTHTSLM